MVSIIIPVYGGLQFLKQTIYSVLNQTYPDWELIIVDDNDPDSEARRQTESLIGKFLVQDQRIRYIKHPRNLNGAVARNTGFSVAKGEYIALLDSDDEYMPNRLQRCVEAMEDAPAEVAGVYTGCEFKRGGRTFYIFKNVSSGNHLVETLAGQFMFCTGSNFFIRKSVVDELNGFDPAFLRHQDYEFLVRIFEKYELKGLPEILVVKNNENFNLPNVERMIEIKRQYLDKYRPLIERLDRTEQDYVYRSHAIGIAESALRVKNYPIAREYYEKAGRYGRLSLRERFRKIAFRVYNQIH